jgi:hypothetical protein
VVAHDVVFVTRLRNARPGVLVRLSDNSIPAARGYGIVSDLSSELRL